MNDTIKTIIYKHLQEVASGIETEEEAITDIARALSHRKYKGKINPKGDDIPNGLYKIFWKTGGYSLASIGRNESGEIWFAPANWISGSCEFDKKRDQIEHMILLYTKQYE